MMSRLEMTDLEVSTARSPQRPSVRQLFGIAVPSAVLGITFCREAAGIAGTGVGWLSCPEAVLALRVQGAVSP